MPKTVTLRLDEEAYEKMKCFAHVERRPLSNFIEHATLNYIDRILFVDESEMAEILSNKELLARLRLGSKQVKKKKGKFVA